ncbi:hypothetical protein ACKVMT_12565 [Halobacteriales archaeon Cl-PHB]
MAPGDHVRPVEATVESGVYRVVGAGDAVALLRVADADGRRVHSGVLAQLDPETVSENFGSAPNPDAGVSLARSAKNALQGIYWWVRRFV